jgi:hypothetical protein
MLGHPQHRRRRASHLFSKITDKLYIDFISCGERKFTMKVFLDRFDIGSNHLGKK